MFPLNPGMYTVMAATQGFKTQIRDGVILQVSDVVEVDFVMELGDVTETIEVTGAAPIMQTQEASVGNVVNTRELERLPVNQRNFTRLILLMPGTSSRRRSSLAERASPARSCTRSTAAVLRTTTTSSTMLTRTCR